MWNSFSDEAKNKHSLASFNSCIRHLGPVVRKAFLTRGLTRYPPDKI